MLKRCWNRLLLPLGLAVILTVAAQAQSGASLAVAGGDRPLTLKAEDLAAMTRATVTTTNNGIQTIYEGVWLSEVLKKAGVAMGANLSGPALAVYIVASASDGYQVVFSIGELDPDMTDGQFLLADKANGKPLFGEDGAFRLVVPKDKRGARSVRMLTKLEIVKLRK